MQGADIGVMCVNADGSSPVADEIIVTEGITQTICVRVPRLNEAGGLIIRRTSSVDTPAHLRFTAPKIQPLAESVFQMRIDIPAAQIDLCHVEIAPDLRVDRGGQPRPVRITRQDGSIETI